MSKKELSSIGKIIPQNQLKAAFFDSEAHWGKLRGCRLTVKILNNKNMANHAKNCDNQIKVGDTPLTPIVSIPSYVTRRQIGLNSLYRKRCNYRKNYGFGTLEVFADHFHNSSRKESRTTLPTSNYQYFGCISITFNYCLFLYK